MKTIDFMTYTTLMIVGILTTGCGSPPPNGPAPPGGGLEPGGWTASDPCAVGFPDAVFEVPEYLDFPPSNSIIRVSTQDTYWYNLYQTHPLGCNRYIVDIKFNNQSNIDCTGSPPCRYPDVLLSADSYNLPSSDGWHHDGTIPNTSRDCNAYNMHVRFYEKLAAEESFTFMEEKVFHAVWNENTQACDITPTPGHGESGIIKSGKGRSENWDTYRVAVKVLLRGLPQQARVIATKYHAPPN